MVINHCTTLRLCNDGTGIQWRKRNTVIKNPIKIKKNNIQTYKIFFGVPTFRRGIIFSVTCAFMALHSSCFYVFLSFSPLSTCIFLLRSSGLFIIVIIMAMSGVFSSCPQYTLSKRNWERHKDWKTGMNLDKDENSHHHCQLHKKLVYVPTL